MEDLKRASQIEYAGNPYIKSALWDKTKKPGINGNSIFLWLANGEDIKKGDVLTHDYRMGTHLWVDDVVGEFIKVKVMSTDPKTAYCPLEALEPFVIWFKLFPTYGVMRIPITGRIYGT